MLACDKSPQIAYIAFPTDTQLLLMKVPHYLSILFRALLASGLDPGHYIARPIPRRLLASGIPADHTRQLGACAPGIQVGRESKRATSIEAELGTVSPVDWSTPLRLNTSGRSITCSIAGVACRIAIECPFRAGLGRSSDCVSRGRRGCEDAWKKQCHAEESPRAM